jgi:class 3 adenylate cyclase
MSWVEWGYRKYTIVFADIRGFTRLSQFHDSEEIAMILGDWFVSAWEEKIKKYGGIIDKFIGDCIMALFSDAEKAFWACCALMGWAKKIDEHLNESPPEGWLGMEFSIGAGLETGEVVEGAIDINGQQHVLRVGDAVNIAARLAEIAEAWEILIGEDAYEELKNKLESEVLTKVKRERKKLGEYSCWSFDSKIVL